ncbi:cytochrome C [Methylomonas rhizoryzae]|uniref:cytochrome C n=1 Tax=Methylomonas rhizoryzae TaxID=2608981 RepID=UPI0012322C71|nr:cytochrome C [Methylomonas rhizoryzae]
MRLSKILVQRSLLFGLLLLSVAGAVAAVNNFDKPVLHPAIPLLDEDGKHVKDSNKPYSTRMSCGNGEGGGCHDIDKIAHSYHFEMGRDEANDTFGSQRGVVPVVSPGYFGGYNCMLDNNPLWLSKKSNAFAGEFLDYGAPGLVKTCGGCHNGGGYAEKDRTGKRYDQTADSAIAEWDGDYFEWQGGDTPSRWDWQQSGVMEPDCLLCHADLSQLKNNSAASADRIVECNGNDCGLTGTDTWSELRANQLLKNGHFREANSAIFQFLNIAPDSENGSFLLRSVSGTASGATPQLTWDSGAFDANGKMQMPMLRFPDNDNCMLCHSTSHWRRGFYGYGAVSAVEYAADGTLIDDYRDDIHKSKTWTEGTESRDIENCNACHSKQYYKAGYLNVDLDADHNFRVGNSDQDVRRDLNYQPGPYSCEYCHGGERFGGAENAALPSGQPTILDAHRELWRANGDMVGYPANSLDRTTLVHLEEIACQTCHIPEVKHDGAALNIRFRYREAEDGSLRMTPYQATPRYYWWDKANQRMVSRRERLQVAGSDAAPASYDEVKQLKAGLDALLSQKGYKNPDTQLVWTESNDYLLSHNTKPSVATMPCDDCHTRDSRGKVSSAVKPDGVLGSKNVRVVAGMSDKTAYPRLVEEGVVKLDMPYYSLSDGNIVENVDGILDATNVEPFMSALRATSHSIVEGEFKPLAASTVKTTLELDGDAAAVSALQALSETEVFFFNNRIVDREMRNLGIVVTYNEASRNIVPNYKLEVGSDNLLDFSRRINRKKTKTLKNYLLKQGKLKGTVTSSVFEFAIRDQNQQRVQSLGGYKMLIKLPYAGRATDPGEVGFLAIDADDAKVLAKKKPFAAVDAQIVSVTPGTTSDYGYVTALVGELPVRGVLYDIKSKKKR